MDLEICVDSLASVIACAEGGADRIELCASLTEGGLTPSAGMISQARAIFPGEIAVMIRPRGGDFAYSPVEVVAMSADIELARELGADAVVFGCLSNDGTVDAAVAETLLEVCSGMPAVFHRAFDVSRDLFDSLETIIELGFDRILTSGGKPYVMQALDTIAALVAKAGDRIEILPGGGIKIEQIAEIVNATKVNQIHLSARGTEESPMSFRRPEIPMGAASVPDEYERRVTDAVLVAKAKELLSQG